MAYWKSSYRENLDEDFNGKTRFESKCGACYNTIPVGTDVRFERRNGKTKAYHLAGACGPKAPPPEMPPVEALVDAVAGWERVSTNWKLAAGRLEEMRAEARKAYPGCKECWGKGWVRVYWSMDAGCSEDVTCKASPELHSHGTYEAWLAATGMDKALSVFEDEARAASVEERAWTERLQGLRWGDYVEVVRGRKVKKGFYRVFWSGEGEYGARVGLLTATGERVYTARSNVEARGLNWKRS